MIPPGTRAGALKTRGFALTIGLGLLLAACTSGSELLDTDPDEQYAAAIEEAETATADDIVTTLTAIKPENEVLTWRGTPGESAVLVVTWTDAPPDTTARDSVTTGEDIWVTAVPEVQDFCNDLDLSGDALNLRLNQRLGLPPDSNYDRFVELWVDPDDLFRPCPDPQITDRQCELDYPEPERFLQVSDDHRAWFEDLRASSYDEDGYPWTRLGYTYDWGAPDDPVGPSEFVIRSDAVVAVASITPTEAYCTTD